MKRSSCMVPILACAVALAVPQEVAASDLDDSAVLATYHYSVLHEHYPVVSLAPEPIEQAVQALDEKRNKAAEAKKQSKKNLRSFYMKLLAVVSAR
ncbi:hypothetical protein QKW35_19690 [Pontibacterium granulatum]|uniref:hypothetical protein n=1 Tax=Pontibacterium granulatum TaxID=2036029 RepID=UPI00249C845F|nr:hypothetical protein [Pontibacterium granulatum]MDI3326606.1 hypothetical protein [Pontibacterium granulatum]